MFSICYLLISIQNHLCDQNPRGGNKVAIQNDKLKDHLIEKPLPMLDLKKWDDCND